MKLLLSLMFSFLMMTHAYAESSNLTPQAQGDVTFVSGGVGEEERNALRAIQGQYNLHLTFAVKGSGEYAAGVKVKIEDAKNHTYLDTTTDGPKLFVQLQPGHYKVTANREGQVLTENVTTPAKHRSAVVFRFSSEKGD